MRTAMFRSLQWHVLRFRSGSDQVRTPQTCPWLPSIVDCVLRVIAMFTVNLFSSLVSSKHEGLSPEWRSYRTRELLFLTVSKALMWFYLAFSEEKPFKSQAADLSGTFPHPQVAQIGGTNIFHFRMVEMGWRHDEKTHMMADCAVLNILVCQKPKWLELLTSHTNISLLALSQLILYILNYVFHLKSI